jgi:hypothetical protein
MHPRDFMCPGTVYQHRCGTGSAPRGGAAAEGYDSDSRMARCNLSHECIDDTTNDQRRIFHSNVGGKVQRLGQTQARRRGVLSVCKPNVVITGSQD